MDDSIRHRVTIATVTVLNNEEPDGRGFLVHGGYILTAAHLVPWGRECEMVLGFPFLVTIVTADGRRLKGEVVAVEVASDIAVIASPGHDDFREERGAFDRFAGSTEALILCKDEFPLGKSFPIHIFTHKEEWISGEATQNVEDTPTLVVETHPPVLAGTSGSTIVNDRGKVVGVASTASDSRVKRETVTRAMGHVPGRMSSVARYGCGKQSSVRKFPRSKTSVDAYNAPKLQGRRASAFDTFSSSPRS